MSKEPMIPISKALEMRVGINKLEAAAAQLIAGKLVDSVALSRSRVLFAALYATLYAISEDSGKSVPTVIQDFQRMYDMRRADSGGDALEEPIRAKIRAAKADRARAEQAEESAR